VIRQVWRSLPAGAKALIALVRKFGLIIALQAVILLGNACGFPENPDSSKDTPLADPEASESIPIFPPAAQLSPDDAPLATNNLSFLVWQGPALDAGPGGTEDAVEYGMARLLPTVAGAKPGGPKVTFGGVFQVDAGWFNQSTASQVTMGDVQDAAGIRRARLTAFGSVAENVDFRMQFDFGFPGRPTFTDNYVDFTRVPLLGTLRVGIFKQPMGLEELTSFRFLTFMERAPNFLLQPFRRVGIGFFNASEDRRATWFVSAYRSGNDQFANDISDSGGYAGMGRFTFLPFINEFEDHFLHIGGSVGYSGANNGNIRYGLFGGNAPEWGMFVGTVGTPEFENSTPSFVNTGRIPAYGAILSNTELAYVLGPFSLQGEVTTSQVERVDNPTAFFYAYYAQASFFLTGEHRPYNRNLGYFDRVMPHTTMGSGKPLGGAWEVALRLSHITLSNAGVEGGDLTDGTFGINWYANPYTIMKFNFIHSFLDNKGNGKGGIYDPSNANVFAIRAQVDF
jgi:phosphate-selective porin OprO/OprP